MRLDYPLTKTTQAAKSKEPEKSTMQVVPQISTITKKKSAIPEVMQLTPPPLSTKDELNGIEVERLLISLLNDFTFDRLKISLTLIQHLVPVDNFLFNIKFSIHQQLATPIFNLILLKPAHIEVFIECLENTPKLANIIITNKFVEEAVVLIEKYSNPVGRLKSGMKSALLRTIITTDLNFINHPYILNWLTQNISSLNIDNVTKVSLLHWLSSRRDGRNVIRYLIEEHPNIIRYIPARTWGFVAEDFTSPLYYLTNDMCHTPNILEWLIQHCNSRIKDIPLETWGVERPANANEFSNTSPLYLLTQEPEGRRIIYLLIQKHLEFFLSLPLKTWGTAIPNGIPGYSANISGLFYLTGTDDGKKIIEAILIKNPHALLQIPSESWRRCSTIIGSNTINNLTPLFFLTIELTGRELLHSILKHCPLLLKGIPVDAWSLTSLSENGNISPIFALASNDPGQTFLIKLLHKYPDLFKDLPTEAWYLSIKTPGSLMNTSALFFMTSSDNGMILIDLLLDLYPTIFIKISEEAWTLRPAIYPNSSALTELAFYDDVEYGRCLNEEGHKILMRIASLEGQSESIIAIINELLTHSAHLIGQAPASLLQEHGFFGKERHDIAANKMELSTNHTPANS